MNRYRTYGRLDDQTMAVGDALFHRLDMRTDPAVLPPGTVQRSENFRFGADGARPRAGIASRLLESLPGTILHAGVYRPDGSNDRLAFVMSDRLVLFNPADQIMTTYLFPSGEDCDAGDPVDFVQGGVSTGTARTAWILRGLGKNPLKFDPASSGSEVTVDSSFRRGLFGVFYQDRMAVAGGPGGGTESQQVDVSDFLDFTTWSTLQQFKVLYGGDDFLVGFLPYQKDLMIVASRKRFFVAYFAPQFDSSGYTGNLSALNSFLRDLTREAGLLARRAFLEAGGLVWALSDHGIFAFQPRLDLELTVLGDPVSAPIQPIMDRLTANEMDGADAKLWQERIYWALPVSDVPVRILDINISGGTATVDTVTAHGCSAGDTIEIKGAATAALNGQFTVVSAPTDKQLTFATSAPAGSLVGTLATLQRLVIRNNAIAVFNLSRPYADPLTGQRYPGAWESVDWLPEGIYADWLLVADDGARRRLWIVDRDKGPFVYEEGTVDEVGNLLGGLRMGATMGSSIGSVTRSSVPIRGRLTSRALRWGAWPKHVKAGETRLTVENVDAGTVIYRVRTPDRPLWESSRPFSANGQSDTSARKRCGMRGLEGEIDIITTAGRPAIRSVAFELAESGRVAEE